MWSRHYCARSLGCLEGIVKPSAEGHGFNLDVIIDVPSGRVTAQVAGAGGQLQHIDFINVASNHMSQWSTELTVIVGSRTIDCHLEFAFGGAVYAAIDVEALNLSASSGYLSTFIDIQRQIRAQYRDLKLLDRYDLYRVIFHQRAESTASLLTQINVVVFADGQVDRFPCASGTAAGVATLYHKGDLKPGMTLMHRSIIETTFMSSIKEVLPGQTAEESNAIVPSVRGIAHLTGRCSFFIDPQDETYPGILLR